MRRGEPWTEEEDAVFRELVDAGEAPKRIAEHLGRSIRSIKLKQERCRRPSKPEGLNLTEEDRALLLSAEFDELGWVLHAVSDATAERLARGHLVENRGGRWYLRPPAFKVRLASGRQRTMLA